MQLSFDGPLSGLRPGQTVRGEVLASDESGSLVLVNGRTAVTPKRLEAGRTINGRVAADPGGGATVTVETGSEEQPPVSGGGEKQLEAMGLPADEENLALLRLLRRYGLPVGADAMQKARELLAQIGVGTDQPGLDLLGLMLARKLPRGAFPLLAGYLKGDLTFARLLGNLPGASLENLRSEWSAGTLLERLTRLLGEGADDAGTAAGKRALGEDFPANLVLQELLSQPPQGEKEGRLYFQWPVFWEGSDLPDTLEGEAFFAGEEGEPGRGFSLRILVHPPALGGMEIGLHRLKETLWVHFGLERPGIGEAVKGIFAPLSDRLTSQGWKEVRLTIGRMPIRPNFLAPGEPVVESRVASRLDIRI